MPPDWKPEIPIREIAPECIAFARKLQLALAATWPRIADRSMGRARVEALGREDWQRVFGYAVTGRHWRRIVKMVQARGGGRGADSDPIAVYLPKRIRRATAARSGVTGSSTGAADPEMEFLAAGMNAIADPLHPTAIEKAWLWGQVFEHFEAGLASGKPERTWKGRILEWLSDNASGLGGSAASLRHLWGGKIAAWRAGGRDVNALKDRRCVSRQAPPLPEGDRCILESTAVLETDGRLAQAYRLVRQRGQLSEETARRFITEASRIDYVPEAVRREIAPILPALAAYHRGPRTGKLNGAHIERDWSGVHAGDWYNADDCTLPVYYYVPGGDWWRLTRGQCLVMIDLRTRRILDFVLIDEKSYDALRVRRLMNRVCERFGLPRRGFYFEGGIWEKSRIVTGGRRASGVAGPAEIETGFRALGIQFRHARTPRAKPVERVLGLLQNRLEAVPGYAGRNEMVDRFERVHRAKLDVDARRKHPAEAGFLSAEEWFERFGRVCEEFNATPLHGRATEGLSPDAAWERFQDLENPPAKLPPEARHLFATHRSVRKIRKNGICISIGKGKNAFVYRSAETGDRVGQQVVAWFDPDSPEFCTITDMDNRNPVTVPRATSIPAMDATREELEEAMASVQSHERAIRERYSRLRASYIPAARPNLVAPSTAALGREMKAQRDAAKGAATKRSRIEADLKRHLADALPGGGGAALAAAAASDPERAAYLNDVANWISS